MRRTGVRTTLVLLAALLGTAAAAVSPDSLYFRELGWDYLWAAAKTPDPTPVQRTPMTFLYSGTVVAMDPAGNYVWEVFDTQMRRFSTADGSFTDYQLWTVHGNGACATDGEFVYVPTALQVYRFDTTGTNLGFNVLPQGVSSQGFSVVNDTLWTTSGVDTVMYGYACSRFTGDGSSLGPDAVWNLGSGNDVPMNIAFDGTYYYATWGMDPTNTFKCFNLDRTLNSTGMVYANTYSVMASATTGGGLDAQAVSVDAPSGDIGSGATLTPLATIRNNSPTRQTIRARMRIEDGSGYNETASVALDPGAQAQVSFPSWTAAFNGSWDARCSTELAGDVNPANDTALSLFTVGLDAQAVSVDVPSGGVGSGATLTPLATIQNNSPTRQTIRARMLIEDGSGYNETASVALDPGAQGQVAFPSWTASFDGSWDARCTTELAGDADPANDMAMSLFTVGFVDVGVLRITSPSGSYDTSQTITPAALVENVGEQDETFNVTFTIDSSGVNRYTDTKTVTVAAEMTVPVSFTPWPGPHSPGSYATRCSTYLAGDGFSGNDVRSGSFSIFAGTRPPGGGWTERRMLPALPTPKGVYYGSFLVNGGARLYAARGNRSYDFFAYDPGRDTWTTLKSWRAGDENKPPAKGVAACYDGTQFIFATKGNNTQGFWKFDVLNDSWIQIVNGVPLGPSGKRVKEGAGMVYVERGDSGFVYLLKGYKNELWRYYVERDTWQLMQPAPDAVNPRWHDGSFLVYDDARYIYAGKANYNQLCRYDITTGAWLTMDSLPYRWPGSLSKKRMKGGGCGAYMDDAIYVLKGGNTVQFWKYRVAGDSWYAMDTMPLQASYSVTRRKVKDGGSIAPFDGDLYAFKGAKTYELWCYVPWWTDAAQPTADSRGGVMAAGRPATGDGRLAITPNPLSAGFATVRCNLPRAGVARVQVFDAAGRQVLPTRTLGSSTPRTLSLDLRSLRAGVYLVRLTADGTTQEAKLVVR